MNQEESAQKKKTPSLMKSLKPIQQEDSYEESNNDTVDLSSLVEAS